MNRPTFFEGVAVALVASAVGAVAYTALSVLIPTSLVVKGLITATSLGYVLYLLVRSPERVGRLSAMALATTVTGIAVVIDPPLAVLILVQLGMVWLIRSLYYYSSILAALTDLGLCALSLAACVWAATQSGSMFLSLWCLFLVQALFVAIPLNLPRKPNSETSASQVQNRFQRAHRAAESALRRLSSHC